jgi:NAD(P)-dependent dehydrogenase (short-subunit alcohol dehydrogenase family)
VSNILITGATGNLGTVVSDYFGVRGHQVFAFVSPGKVPKGYQKDGFSYWEADLSNEAATALVVEEIIKQHGHIDAAFLLAGGFAMGDMEQSPLEAIHKMITINFDTAYTVARSVYRQMMNQGGGKIIFVGAKPALELSGNAMLGYALSKAMLFNLVAILNKESEKSKVSCSVIVPSTIDTPANREAMPNANFSDWVKPEAIAQKLEKILLTDSDGQIIKLY